MAAIDRLIERFKQSPSDFEWGELAKLLGHFGYEEQTGKGSRRKFVGETLPTIILHEPHPKKVLKRYAMNYVRELLEGEGLS